MQTSIIKTPLDVRPSEIKRKGITTSSLRCSERALGLWNREWLSSGLRSRYNGCEEARRPGCNVHEFKVGLGNFLKRDLFTTARGN